MIFSKRWTNNWPTHSFVSMEAVLSATMYSDLLSLFVRCVLLGKKKKNYFKQCNPWTLRDVKMTPRLETGACDPCCVEQRVRPILGMAHSQVRLSRTELNKS